MINNKNNKYPIIIAGMHRSGTSLLSKILSKMNVFMGQYQDSNNESIYFQRLNRWIMSCVGSSWDNPKSFNNIDTSILENKLLSSLNLKTNNFTYFGFSKTFQNHTFQNINYMWGWKDPSNTFTLPIWAKLFPENKIIYVLRHPLDVSISLLTRNNILNNQETFSKSYSFFSKYSSLLTVSQGGISSSLLISDIDDCLKLYNTYYNEINSLNNNQNILFVKYEDLLLNTKSVLNEISKFICININQENYLEIKNIIDISRAYSFKGQTIKYSTEYLNSNIYNE